MKENNKSKSVIIMWILFCSVMVIIMVMIGGFTRLSKAGLSITEWKPITGIIPPLSEEDWIKEKLKYESTPEYKLLIHNIDIKKFKYIYIIEYIHRLFARITGLVFLLPFVYFFLKRKINKKETLVLIVIFLLEILQAIIGWYMVKSGLISKPHVNHYMLALHLIIALIIFALLINQFFNYQIKSKQVKFKIKGNIILYTKIILILIFIEIILGAFVAGLNAGLIYNTFPLMDGVIIPEDLFLQKISLNIFENSVVVQFIHRTLALLILILIITLIIKNKSIKPTYIMLICTLIQIILGIITLLTHVSIFIAILHQVFSFILFGSGLYLLSYFRKCCIKI